MMEVLQVSEFYFVRGVVLNYELIILNCFTRVALAQEEVVKH